MEPASYGIKLLKKLFWWANLPGLLLASIYCVITHQNPVDSFLFIITISLCIPYAFIKVEEHKDKMMNGMHNELSELSDKELIVSFR
jgi:Mg2+/citrate symporter